MTFPYELSDINWYSVAYNTVVITANIVMYYYAKPLVAYFNGGKQNNFQLTILRSVNILFFVLQVLDIGISFFTNEYSNSLSSLAYTLLLVYIGAFIFNILSFFSRRKFGKEITIDTKKSFMDTYNSRLIDIFIVIIVSMLTLYLIINVWGMTSLLETTGILGLLVAFLALTNQIWAPDPYYCMVILSSEMMEDGDIIKINDEPHEYIISRVTFIYTILYDVTNNHRTLIRNSNLIEKKIENLSKKASIDGLRYRLSYKIGYPDVSGTTQEAQEKMEAFMKKVDQMFALVQTKSCEDENVKVNPNLDFNWALTHTGDYALEFTLVYYLETLPNTKLTKTVRTHIYTSQNKINSYVYESSVIHGLSLATPDLIERT